MTKASDLGKWAIGINSLPANIIRTIGVGIGTTNPTVMLDVSECIKASQLNVSGISTISTLISPSLVAGSTLDEVNITGFTTSASGVSVAEVNVSGGATVGGFLNANKGLEVVAGARFDQINVGSISTFSDQVIAGKGLHITGAGVSIASGGINVTAGVSTFTGDAEILVGAAITIGRTGVSTFVSDLHVGGSQAAGVVLTSPDGTRYRLVVANGGALSTSAV